MSRRGRPRHPDVLTPAEWRVLEQIRQGRSNAEIAVRLGLSVNTVRYHVSNMLAKLDVPDRHALADWRQERRAWGWLAFARGTLGRGAIVIGVGAIIASVAVALGGRGGRTTGAAAIASPTETPPLATFVAQERQPLPLPQTAGFRIFAAKDLDSAGFVDTGVAVAIPYNPFPSAESAYRGIFTAVRLAAAGYLRWEQAGGNSWTPDLATVRNAVSLEGVVDGQHLRMDFFPLSAAGAAGTLRVLRPASDGVALYSADESVHPVVGIELTDAQGHHYPVVADNQGHFLFRPAPAACEVWATDTGECLDVRAATRLDFPPTTHDIWQSSTNCAKSPCRVTLFSTDQILAPTDGTVSCHPETDRGSILSVDFTTDAFRLRFSWAVRSGAEEPSCADIPSGVVVAGTRLANGFSGTVAAFDAKGAAISLAAGERTLYVGGISPAVGSCPCAPTGN